MIEKEREREKEREMERERRRERGREGERETTKRGKEGKGGRDLVSSPSSGFTSILPTTNGFDILRLDLQTNQVLSSVDRARQPSAYIFPSPRVYSGMSPSTRSVESWLI